MPHTAAITALVINLEHSTQRLAFQQAQLAHLGIAMQRLSAVGTNSIDPVRYEQLANGWQRKLRLAEVACFLSHQLAWQYVAANGQPMLILEDDALLSQHTPELLAALNTQPPPADLVSLETRSRKKLLGKHSWPASPHFKRHPLYQDRTGAAAYVLYPQGAQKLLHQSANHAPALADAFISSCYSLSAYQIVPAAAIQLDQCQAYGLPFDNPFASTITPADNHKPAANTTADALQFKLRRIGAQIKMGWRQLSLVSRSSRSHVGIRANDLQLPPNGLPSGTETPTP